MKKNKFVISFTQKCFLKAVWDAAPPYEVSWSEMKIFLPSVCQNEIYMSSYVIEHFGGTYCLYRAKLLYDSESGHVFHLSVNILLVRREWVHSLF